jgi:hypothetical protein
MKLSVAVLMSLLFCGIASCQTVESPEQEIERIIKSRAYEGHDDKVIGRMGDAAAVAITKVISDKDLSPEDIEIILLVVRMSFAAPRIVEIRSDRQPRTTLFLLKYLDSLAIPPDLKRKIAETKRSVEQSAKSSSG